MISVHMVTGNKGNVGKTTLSQAIMEYYRQRKRGLIVMDGDKDTETLSKIHRDAMLIFLSEDPAMASQADIILTLARQENTKKEAERSHILIDLPAGGEKLINSWIADCGVNESIRELIGATFFKWWVCDSDPHSISLFEESLAENPSIHHIFLKNMGRSSVNAWDLFNKKKKIHSMEKRGELRIVEIPRLDLATLQALRANNVPFSNVVDDTEFQNVDVAMSLRLRSWLTRVHSALEEIIVWKDSEPQKKVKEPAVSSS